MKCLSCGVENPALSQRCSNCGKAFPRPEENNTLENVDRSALSGEGDKPKEPGAKRPGPGVGGSSLGSLPIGGTHPQSEDWKHSQVISKTPSGIGRNDLFSKGTWRRGRSMEATIPRKTRRRGSLDSKEGLAGQA